MLSTGFSIAAITRRAVLAAGLALFAACAPAPSQQVVGVPGPTVDLNAPVRVALLVPLGSGDPGREQIGRSLVNAARLAQADLQGVELDLRVYETAGTTGGGASAAQQAVAEGAQIILGPLFSTATAAAEPIASAAGVSLISFSNNPAVASASTYILGLTFDSAADRVVSHALSRGLSNVAVVYPNGLEGETARAAVAAAARIRGANLVAQQGYDLSVQGIDRAAPAIADTLRSVGANAVVLADGPVGGLGLIADGLRGQGLAADSAPFLGIQRWNVSAEVLTQDSLQGSWFAAPDPGILATFEGRYSTAYGERPHEVAGLAYDGVAMVGALIRDARARNVQTPFAPANLTQPTGFAGVYGPFRLLPSGSNQRNLAVLEVRGGTAAVIDRAPRTFVAVGN
jgi:ABC-type branched-subunit amino acid transport system substrate-binding protein